MVKIHRSILPQSLRNVPNRSMKPKYITIHNTANSSRGADAEVHARYQRNGSGGRLASWHYTVDDKEIYQTLEDNQQGWHAGTSKGNSQSIGIEICENSDGDFSKAVKNAQWLVKRLMDKHDIPISRVVTHKYWSGKNCPRLILSRWDEFKDGIGKSSSSKKTITKPKKADRPKPSTNSIVDYLNSIGEDSSFSNRKILADKYGIDNYKGTASQNLELLERVSQHHYPAKKKVEDSPKRTSSYTGNSIVDYLNSLGMESSFNARKKLATKYKISNYKGTASQNLKLLNAMRDNEPAKTTTASKTSSTRSSSYKGSSIVDYLKSIGENSSFSNRKRLASRYGISNYKGTASQNSQLLKKMRGF